MRVVVVGSVGESAAKWSTENDLAASLVAMGHAVDPLPELSTEPGLMRERCDAADVVLWVSTPGNCRPEVAAAILASATVKVSFHLDLYRGLNREGVTELPFFRSQFVLTADGGAPAGWWESRGVNHRWSPPGVLASSCYLAEPDRERYPHDVVFVGSRGYHHEHPWRARVIDALRERYGARFGLYEHGWLKDRNGGHGIENKMRGHNANVLYASARVAVGDSCFAGRPEFSRYCSDRLFEAGGRGAVQVWPRIGGCTEMLDPDSDEDALMREGAHLAGLFDAGDVESLYRAVDRALDLSDADAMALRRRSIEHTKENHTYAHRLWAAFEWAGVS